MGHPTWPDIALLLCVLAGSMFLFLHRIQPILSTIIASPRDPGFVLGSITNRLGRFAWEVFLQGKVIRERPLPGLAHAIVFWGFLAFSLVTLNHFAIGFGLPLLTPEGPWARVYFTAAGIFATLVAVSIAALAYRRFVIRPKWLGPISRESGMIAALIFALMATYLAGWLWLPDGTLGGRVNWWLHTLALLIFLPLVPGTKHLHLILSPISIFLARDGFSQIPPLEGEADFGIETGKNISQIVALQAFSCVECGRCTEHCPASNTGKLLDPKKIALGVRQYLRDNGANSSEPIIGKYIPEEMLWQCTSCGACEYQCPVGIQHLPIIVGLRRGLVNTGKWDDEYGNKLFRNLELKGNAFGFAPSERDKFIAKAELPIFDGTQEYCLWLGCMGGYDPRGREIVTALARVMDHLGTTFGVLRKEKCTGDPVRRLGNDYLFTEGLARFNLDQITAAKAVKLITICPHCVRTMVEDWKEIGAKVEVEHHSEFLARNQSALSPNPEQRTAVYHDPCYLGRYRGIYDEPRKTVAQAGNLMEAERTREKGFCCGAGGGRVFLGDEEGKRVNVERAEQLVATGAEVIAAACPFCNTMFRDALTQISPAKTPQLLDIAQIAAASLPQKAPHS